MESEVSPCCSVWMTKELVKPLPFPNFCIIRSRSIPIGWHFNVFFRNHSRTYFKREHTLHTPKMTEQEDTFSAVRFHKSSGLQNEMRLKETRKPEKARLRGKCLKCLKSLFKKLYFKFLVI